VAQIYARVGTRCQEHPHRPAEDRCDRCGQPFCRECLLPTPRAADGTRNWYCHACTGALAEVARRRAEQQTMAARLRRMWGGLRAGLVVAALAGGLAAAAAVGVALLGARGQGMQATGATLSCGELSRVRSVGAIGLPAPTEVVNALTYPLRATVRPVAGEVGNAAEASALVDECGSGWRSAPDTVLPVGLVIQPPSNGFWLQRIVLWQDPEAPRAAWVRDFEVLASPTADGDDFRPLRLDRPAQLASTVEQQWFSLIQPPVPGGVPPEQMAAQERARYAQAFPDVVFTRRLLVRILSTYGELEPPTAAAGVPTAGIAERPAGPRRGLVALGEVGAYGPDLEVTIADVVVDGDRTGDYAVTCQERASRCTIHALAGRPVSVLVLNQSWDAHTFVTSGQDRNLSLAPAAGQAISGTFFAASQVGQYDFACRLPGHAIKGLAGRILVR
jgi:hypothetical protein